MFFFNPGILSRVSQFQWHTTGNLKRKREKPIKSNDSNEWFLEANEIKENNTFTSNDTGLPHPNTLSTENLVLFQWCNGVEKSMLAASTIGWRLLNKMWLYPLQNPPCYPHAEQLCRSWNSCFLCTIHGCVASICVHICICKLVCSASYFAYFNPYWSCTAAVLEYMTNINSQHLQVISVNHSGSLSAPVASLPSHGTLCKEDRWLKVWNVFSSWLQVTWP